MSDLAQILPALAGSLENFLAEVERSRRVVAAATEEALKAAEPFIGKEEAAKFLNMSVTTLERRMAEADGPPRYVDGGKVNFLRSELRVWRRQWRAGDQAGLEELKAS